MKVLAAADDCTSGYIEGHNMTRWWAAILGLTLIIILTILVWDKQSTIYPYLFLSLAIAALLSYSIISYKEQRSIAPTIIFILVVFVFLRNVSFISTHYGALTPGDVSWEYAVINTFLAEGEIFVIRGESMLTWYSSWPALHSVSLVFSIILDVAPDILPVVLPTIFGFIGFLFLYLLLDKLTTGLNLSKVLVPLGLLLYAVTPESIYYGWKFVHQGMGVMLVLISLYLLYKYIRTRDLRILALIIVNALLLVVVHHYTSFIFAGYLLIFSGLVLASDLLVRVWRRITLWRFSRQALVMGILGLVVAGSIFLWWSEVGTIISEKAETSASAVTTALSGGEPIDGAPSGAPSEAPGGVQIEPYVPVWHYPEELTPSWIHLLRARDFLIFIPVFFGFSWLLWEIAKKKSVAPEESSAFGFLAISLICFGGIFLFELFISQIEPYRVALLGLPFIALGSGVLYMKTVSKSRWAVLAVLVLITTTSFLGLWGHRYAPIHLYASSVSAEEVGESMPLDDKHNELQGFVNQNIVWEEFDWVLSDAPHLLYRLIPSQEYDKIGPRYRHRIADALHRTLVRNEDLIAIDLGTSLYTHYNGVVSREEAAEQKEKYYSELEANLDKIYDNGFEIWVTRN